MLEQPFACPSWPTGLGATLQFDLDSRGYLCPVDATSLQGYPRCDEEVARIADELWGEGKGQAPIFILRGVHSVLRQPDGLYR